MNRTRSNFAKPAALAALAVAATLAAGCSDGNQSTPTPVADDSATAPPAQAATITVPEGRLLTVRFADELSTATSTPGQAFRAELTEPVLVDGAVAIPAGTTIHGIVEAVNPADRMGGKASLDLSFDTLELGDRRVPIAAGFYSETRGEKKKDAERIGGGIVGGAILGEILDKDAEDGAAVGAVAGTIIAAVTKGDEVKIPVGAEAHLRLSQPVTL